MTQSVLLIPARLNSSRLPNKLSLDLGGEPVLCKTMKQALKTTCFSEIALATDSQLLADMARHLGLRVIITPSDFQNGSERCAYALSQGIFGDSVVVLQGDEPFVDPALLDTMARALQSQDTEMVSAMYAIDQWSEFDEMSVVKVVCNHQKEALYFSRSPIPHIQRDDFSCPPENCLWGHIGVYGYQREALLRYASLQTAFLEDLESLEQLRALHAGWRIYMIPWKKPLTGINTLSDLEKARAWLHDISVKTELKLI